jgi:hypothetical protein
MAIPTENNEVVCTMAKHRWIVSLFRSTSDQRCAERSAVQLPQAHCEKLLKANDRARAAVSCNGGLGGLANDAGLLPT